MDNIIIKDPALCGGCSYRRIIMTENAGSCNCDFFKLWYTMKAVSGQWEVWIRSFLQKLCKDQEQHEKGDATVRVVPARSEYS